MMPPKFALIYWDGECLPALSNQYQFKERFTIKERLAVVVGNFKKLKLLGTAACKR